MKGEDMAEDTDEVIELRALLVRKLDAANAKVTELTEQLVELRGR
jgi:hypothetical protein